MARYIFLESKDGASNNRQLMKAIIQNGEIIGWQKVIKYPPASHVDEDYVNEKIKEADPDFKGTFDTWAEIQSITLVNANDWAYLRSLDEQGNDQFTRYRYTNENGWVYEVCIKRDNFTDSEWAAITSGITAEKVQKLDGLSDTAKRPFKSTWHTDTTLLQFCQDVTNDEDAVVGEFYLGGLSCSGLPDGMQNGEVTVEIMQGNSNMKLLRLTLTSTNLHPYHWELSYFNGTLYGWRSWITPQEFTDIIAIPSAIMDRMKNGDEIVKVVGNKKFTYHVMCKDESLNELSLVYVDHETIEEVYYEKQNGVWTYIVTERQPYITSRDADSLYKPTYDETTHSTTFPSAEFYNPQQE